MQMNTRNMHQENKTESTSLLHLPPLLHKVLFLILAALCLTPWISPPIALLMGLVFSQLMSHPFEAFNQKATGMLLKISVVGLGFGMNFLGALKAGSQGFVFTIVSIAGTLFFGYLLGKIFKIEKKTSYLISSGTAICGGSAIAAIAPVIKAEQRHISVALGIIFILNSVALFVFPPIGHFFELSQTDFGLWCAIAIHDTSSVVGSTSKYGAQALEVATTVKLARALWIIPLAFISAFIFKNKETKIKIPYFIALFVLAMLAATYIPFVGKIGPYCVLVAKAGLTLTLFMIGSSLSRKVLLSVGYKPFILGILLWLLVSISSFLVIYSL